jgi:hypothetical protein
MEVAHRTAKEEPPDAAQHRVAEVAVQQRHGARRDAAGKAVAHHQVRALAQLGEKRVERAEIVAFVGVAHDHVLPARGLNPGAKRAAVAAAPFMDHPGAGPLGGLRGPVAAAVVDDEDFPRGAASLQIATGLRHARGHRLDLVETGHQDRQFAGIRGAVHSSPQAPSALLR